jgi:hypothetical protein
MVALVRRKFGLENKRTIVLKTTSLETCKGQFIEIDESAWSFVRPFLPLIYIFAIGSEDDNSRTFRS